MSPMLSSHEGGGVWPGGLCGPLAGLGRKVYFFGDGEYSQNIVQGGSVLQPTALHTFVYTYNISPQATLSLIGTMGGGTLSQFADGVTTVSVNATNATGNAVIFQFPTARNIGRLGSNITSPATEGIKNAKLQYSDDGVTWYDTNQNNFTIQTYSVTYIDINDYGAHRWWRVYQPGTAYLQSSEIQLFERITLPNCIVVTGAATVAPDATTGASVFTAENIVVDGGTLSPSTNSKGLIGIVSGSIRVMNGGRIHIDKLGKAGNFGNLTAYDLAPESLKRKLKRSALDAYVVQGEGAAGAARTTTFNVPKNGIAAGAMQSGGGGTGASFSSASSWAGAGGKGGPCCGGAASGAIGGDMGAQGTADAGDYGGPGTNGVSNGQAAGGGAGDPVGTGSANGEGAGGGLLMLFSPSVSIASGCIVSADGAKGGFINNPGGSAGGGIVCIVTNPGGYANAGTVRASGGAAQTSSSTSGAGGAGSVNIFTV